MFPIYIQSDSKDCGATCLKIIAKHYDRTLNIQTLRKLSETTREGTNLLSLSEASEYIGFRSLGIKLNITKLSEAPLPLTRSTKSPDFEPQTTKEIQTSSLKFGFFFMPILHKNMIINVLIFQHQTTK